jgi:hypothetical protein
LSPAFTLHGRLGLGTISEPSMTIDGADYEAPRGTTVTFSLIALGLTYSLMPLNLFLTGAVGIAGIGVRDDDDDTDDDRDEVAAGPTVEFDIGKEWWIGPQLGLGLALRLSYLAADYHGTVYDAARSYFGVSLLCSLAYQ